MKSEGLWCAFFMGRTVTFLFQIRKRMHRTYPESQRTSNKIGSELKSVGLYNTCFCIVQYIRLLLNSEILWRSNHKAFPPYLPRTLLTTITLHRILLFIINCSSWYAWKLRGICNEGMEGELIGTAHKSSTFRNVIIYRLAYFRNTPFWFH